MSACPKRTKILYVNSSARLYGADKSLLEMVANLDKGCFEPVVMAPEDGPLVTECRKIGVRAIIVDFVHVERRHLAPSAFFKFMRDLSGACKRIRRLILDEGIDIVHSNTSACVASAIAAKMAGKPHVWHVRELVTRPRLIRLAYRIVLPLLADKAFAASQAVRVNYSTGWNGMNDKFVVLPHGVDTGRFETGLDAIRGEFSISRGIKIVGNVGMMRAQKGQRTFLSIARIVKDRYPEVKFIIAGDLFYQKGAIDRNLLELCDSLGLADDVIFTGFRTDIENVFASFDVFAHTSEMQESYGRTILEAMASGKPVVAFRSGGPGELVKDESTGFLVAAGDVLKMAEKIVVLLTDDELSRRMGEAGHLVVSLNYSSERYTKSLQEHYRQCLPCS